MKKVFGVHKFGDDLYVGFRRIDENKVEGFMLKPHAPIEEREEFEMMLLQETRDWYATEWCLEREKADLMIWALGYLHEWDADKMNEVYQKAKESWKCFNITL